MDGTNPWWKRLDLELLWRKCGGVLSPGFDMEVVVPAFPKVEGEKENVAKLLLDALALEIVEAQQLLGICELKSDES